MFIPIRDFALIVVSNHVRLWRVSPGLDIESFVGLSPYKTFISARDDTPRHLLGEARGNILYFL